MIIQAWIMYPFLVLGSWVSTTQISWDEDSGRVINYSEANGVLPPGGSEMLGRQKQNDLHLCLCLYLHLLLHPWEGPSPLFVTPAALASFLSLEPLNPLPPPILGTCSLPLPGPLPERLDHSHPLALSSNNPFYEASLAIHPSGPPIIFYSITSFLSFIALLTVYS